MEQQKEFTGVWIPKIVIEDERLNKTDAIVYAEVACFDVCYKSNESLGKRWGLKKNTVSIAISKLKSLGYLFSNEKTGEYRQLSVIAGNVNQRGSLRKIKEALSEKSKRLSQKNHTIEYNKENNKNKSALLDKKYWKAKPQANDAVGNNNKVNFIKNLPLCDSDELVYEPLKGNKTKSTFLDRARAKKGKPPMLKKDPSTWSIINLYRRQYRYITGKEAILSDADYFHVLKITKKMSPQDMEGMVVWYVKMDNKKFLAHPSLKSIFTVENVNKYNLQK